jgi:hypothetical protein
VAQFIADSMDQSVDDIRPIAQAIYTKTLGNIFFVQQALEELVRQNVVYYDVMCFALRTERPMLNVWKNSCRMMFWPWSRTRTHTPNSLRKNTFHIIRYNQI